MKPDFRRILIQPDSSSLPGSHAASPLWPGPHLARLLPPRCSQLPPLSSLALRPSIHRAR